VDVSFGLPLILHEAKLRKETKVKKVKLTIKIKIIWCQKKEVFKFL